MINQSKLLRKIKTLLIDIDGTLLKGDVALSGMEHFFEFLKLNRIDFLVMTNNSTKSPVDYANKLSQAGADIDPEKIITSSTITARYIADNFPQKTVYAIGQHGIFDALEKKDIYPVTGTDQSVDVCVVAGDYQLTYEKLKSAILFIQRDAEFIGTNPDLLVPTEEGLVPECGTTLAAIEAATGKKPLIIGKPNKLIFDLAIEIAHADHATTAIIGDRISTDIIGGHNAGITTILIETGVDNINTISNHAIRPDIIVKDLSDLTNKWRKALDKNAESKND